MRVKAEAAGINALFYCFCLGRRAAGGGTSCSVSADVN